MSTLKVDNIRHNSATSDAITMASDGTCTARITGMTGGGGLSHRNLIINGACLIAQRGVSHTGNGYATVDRIKPMNGGGAITQEQVDISSSDTPYTLGFRKAFKLTNSTAASDVNDYRDIRYNVEAQDIANSGFNLGSASSKITFSFWAKSSVAMTYYYFIYATDSGKHYVASFALSANTWTKVTKIIPGASGLSVNNDNGQGFNIQIATHYGSNWTTSGQAIDTWGAWNGSSRVPDMASTWASTTNATFELTGLQLEVGDTATSFEHRSYGDELRRCERYFQCMKGPSSVAGGTGERCYGIAHTYSSSRALWSFQFKTEMRSSPTVSINSVSNLQVLSTTAWNTCTSFVSTNNFHKFGGRVDMNFSGSVFTANGAGEVRILNDAVLGFSAEL